MTVCEDSESALISNSNTCVCLGDVVIYKCTIMGGGIGGSTIFRGSSFNCYSAGNIDRLALPHSQFAHPQGTKKSCNNGTIIAQSLHGENGTYSSQLSITVTSELISDAIECAHDTGMGAIEIVGTAITGVNFVHIFEHITHEHQTFSCRTFFLFMYTFFFECSYNV
jgi:hypothetical protein